MTRIAEIPARAAALALVSLGLSGAEKPAAAEPEAIVVPSGQAITYLETVQATPGPEGLTTRFRFVAPGIARDAGGIDAEAAQEDMAWLCENFAVPRLPATGPIPSQVIISLADRAVPFGEAAPDVTQFFEAYSIDGGRCVWEPF